MSKKLIEASKEIQKINEDIEPYPWHVWTRLFGRSCKPAVFSNQLYLGPDSDGCTIEEARAAVAYLVEQLGGNVKWKK